MATLVDKQKQYQQQIPSAMSTMSEMTEVDLGHDFQVFIKTPDNKTTTIGACKTSTVADLRKGLVNAGIKDAEDLSLAIIRYTAGS